MGVLPLPSAGNKQRATCSATLLQNELNNDVPSFATRVRTCLATNKVVRVFFVDGKRRKTAIQLVLQQSRKTSCTFFLARYIERAKQYYWFRLFTEKFPFKNTWLINALYMTGNLYRNFFGLTRMQIAKTITSVRICLFLVGTYLC